MNKITIPLFLPLPPPKGDRLRKKQFNINYKTHFFSLAHLHIVKFAHYLQAPIRQFLHFPSVHSFHIH